MFALPGTTENELNALLTYHPTTTALLAVVGVVVLITIAIMIVTVELRKKFTVPRSPENWDKEEVYIMSMFLHIWYLWACDEKDAPTEFAKDDELDVAFDKYVKELLHTGVIDKYWHGEDLMQELFCHAGLDSKHPFGMPVRSTRSNANRIEFAKHYAKQLRSLFIDMA